MFEKDVSYHPDNKPVLNYEKLFILIKQIHVSLEDVAAYANITPQTLLRLRQIHNNVTTNVLMQILNALYKLTDHKYEMSDISDTVYHK